MFTVSAHLETHLATPLKRECGLELRQSLKRHLKPHWENLPRQKPLNLKIHKVLAGRSGYTKSPAAQ